MFIKPLDRSEGDIPRSLSWDLAILGTIADKMGHKMEVFDINVMRQGNTPEAIKKTLEEEGKPDDYDMFWISAKGNQFPEANRLIQLLRGLAPDSVIILSGMLAEALTPEELFSSVGSEKLDVAVREGYRQEEIFKRLLDKTRANNWDGITGIAYPELKEGAPTGKFVDTSGTSDEEQPDIDALPSPNFKDFLPYEQFMQFSPIEYQTSKKRFAFSWERHHPTNHKLYYPSPENCIELIKRARYELAIDFVNFSDQSIFSRSKKWSQSFFDLYMDEELNELAPWSCSIEPNVWFSVSPGLGKDLLRKAKDAGMRYVRLDVLPGQEGLQPYLNAVDTCRRFLTPIVPMKVTLGLPKQTFDDILELTEFLTTAKPDAAGIEILQPWPGTTYYQENKDLIKSQYEDGLQGFLNDENLLVTALVSEHFELSDLITLQCLMRARDFRKMLILGHMRGWKHADKWKHVCPTCKKVLVDQVLKPIPTYYMGDATVTPVKSPKPPNSQPGHVGQPVRRLP